MVTHWESSRRPLYVRTIWKDGQHHVILDKTKEKQQDMSTSRRSKQCPSSQNSHRTTKSAGTGVNLKVSSVRVLLSGIKGFKNIQIEARITEKSTERPKTWTHPVLNRPVTCKDLNKEVTFNSIRGFQPPNLKSNTLDSDLTEPQTLEKYRSNIVLDNALSERVMIWLDLATHSNNSYTDKDIKTAACTVTAQACNIIKATAPPPEKQMEIKQIEECKEHSADNIVDSSILKNTSPRQDDKRTEDIIVFSNEELEIPQDNFYHVLTPSDSSSDEYTYKEESVEEDIDTKANSVKRQLHIFMPNLPKKSGDCDSSILSSKISVNTSQSK